ncbi:hypothetical protein PtA15_8A359 [Puccinia triticina]|uniref:Alpha/beta hydrolase fold-3 domain-containing protein n=1 Tax=Puccinia triticina TaxID=208348 RepID=A0ABY7CUJ5_9BASI|nr:uncharacterized protein PtA15_8A359 [Puccinia triticina]WAQ87455.1 hypothetical protein PtA15_8A359 [Puccinia triticina]
MPFLKSATAAPTTTNQASTSSASKPTSVSATTSIPSKNQTGTRLPTSPSALKSLLAPFNSIPTTDQTAFDPPAAPTNQHIPSPSKPQPSSPKPAASHPVHCHSVQPPTSDQITTDADQTGGPDSSLIQANHLAKYSPAARIPGTNRIGIDLGQRPASPQISVRNAWQYLPFLTKQATNIASSFVFHHLKGPPKKSWGIEMTIFTAIVREMANYTHLSSIHQLRTLMDFGQILPTPKDGIITPVSFKVKPNNLTGFLKELDQAEKGDRILTGEWVVSKKTWKRLQTESLARRTRDREQGKDYGFGQPADLLPNPHHQHGLGQDKVIYFIHGGAYFIMSASTHRPLTISIAKYTECRLFAINYRLAPETKFPGPLHDAVAGYFRLLNDLCIPAQNIVVAGDSAGGGLVMALLMYLRDEGYPLPSAAMLYSPWCDLTMSCDSWETNQPYDFLPMPKPDDPLNPVKCYLGEDGIKKWITHPYVSPLFGDMHGLPPLLIQAGDAEVLRDEITLLAHKASLHGVKVIHEIYEDCVHVFQAFLFLESSTKALQSMRNYIRHVLPKMSHDEASDSEEVLSADEDSGEEDEVLDASAEAAGPSQAHEQQPTDPLASGSDTTVNADLQAIFHNLITTPSELKTTVYTQSDDEEEDQETYFQPFNPLRTNLHPDQQNLQQQQHVRSASPADTVTASDNVPAAHLPSNHSQPACFKAPNVLICCGDVQLFRNHSELQTFVAHIKYHQVGTFWQYYSGEKVIYGSSIAIDGSIDSIQTSGASGIYKRHDCTSGHYERLPYFKGTIHSIYHVHKYDIFRVSQLPIATSSDISLSHDWPVGIEQYGNIAQLLWAEHFFKDEAAKVASKTPG